MALPINIEDLIHGQTIEWERLECKAGWNPEAVLHTMCAFANDLQNWGGGYIVVGISEKDGKSVLPPAGLAQGQIDAIQKEIITLGNRITPPYFPIAQPYALKGKHILVLWCPAGDNRPYTAPATLGSKGAERRSFVRIGSESIIARDETLRRLQELTARIPFDDRLNNQARVEDVDLGLIQAYLQEIKSDLYAESVTMPLGDLCRSMQIARGPDEDLRPVNVGLLFFTKAPERFFSRAWIELVHFTDARGETFREIYFKGPLHHQIRDALSYLQTNVIVESVQKHAAKAEAERAFNFPFAAVEEAVSNAVYHKSYEVPSPIEIQVWHDNIIVQSHPGPMPPMNANVLRTERRIIARDYRNRRIGDFLKELRLTEGRGTGFPTIYNAMMENGSPPPRFDTDEQSYVLVTLPVHPAFATGNDERSLLENNEAGNQGSNQAGNQVTNQVKPLLFKTLREIVEFTNQVTNQVTNQAVHQIRNVLENSVHGRVENILDILSDWLPREEIFRVIGLTNQHYNRKKYLDPLMEAGWVRAEYPDKPTSPRQRYIITEAGKRLLQILRTSSSEIASTSSNETSPNETR